MYDNTSRVIEVDIDEILPNRFQPRIQFDEEEILELSDSIKEHGVIQPLVVRTIGDKYEIIAGERRYKASVLAGKETVPVIIKNLNDKDSAEIALIENIQRKNLTPIEEALSYKKILDMGYITQENLASKLGKSQSAVANKIRLLNLSDEVQEALLENKISERHARSLLKISNSTQQNEMLNRIISERLTVRRADEEIEKMKNGSSDESNDDSQKIIEKGEIDMNNNMFGMPNVPENPQPTTPSFDIFGTGNQQPVPTQPTVNPIPEVAQPTPSFNIFETDSNNDGNNGGMTSVNIPTMESVPSIPEIQPMVEPVIPSAPVVPEVSTVTAVPEMPTMESTPSVQEIQPMVEPIVPSTPTEPEAAPIFAVPTMESVPSVPETQLTVEPVIPSAPVVPEVPTVAAVPEMPTIGGIQFDANGNVVAAPSVAPMPTMESTPSVPEIQALEPVIPSAPVVPEVPQTAPIMESPIVENNEMTQQSENLFSFGDNDINSLEPQTAEVAPTVPEFKMPEPIIVTDYSKQYDPVMPQTAPVAPTVDFKEVISAIRECSSKIEQYGFKIDVEEYDLANLYQVIFKIEK